MNKGQVPSVGTGDGLAEEATQALERIRAAKKPTRRGILVCGQIMAEMLRIGWKKEQLDALEILFWSVRDGNGEVIKHSSANVKDEPRPQRQRSLE
jgi:hypothetical protein